MSKVVHTFTVPPDHPSLAGHFPGNPVMPAVVLLDLARVAIAGREPWTLQAIASARFLQPVRPGEEVSLEVETLNETTGVRARFRGLRGGHLSFEGAFLFSIVGAT